uniref:Uncharacterized protein n=1 Tax=Sus scrofa TaxID=9823 RepID=A0A8W4FG08_PIG
MAILQKSTNNKCCRGCLEEGTLVHCWWDCKLVQPLWKTVWRKLMFNLIALAILGLLWFHINFWIVGSGSLKNIMGNLIGIALNL